MGCKADEIVSRERESGWKAPILRQWRHMSENQLLGGLRRVARDGFVFALMAKSYAWIDSDGVAKCPSFQFAAVCGQCLFFVVAREARNDGGEGGGPATRRLSAESAHRFCLGFVFGSVPL
ncbi:hypothetical protein THAOC_00422 [Thalassiosira oceanica]|uniref:Uncharacterized protein n=1 Tax=Thalassiosira oceanica TaxID=159749 RepID=K3W4D1_THAOC|nr:hypothetical protein THAOC_00422 [Thalassiosira oceanica]|eukprot:EJK77729.1 hypothetical protein THAOC_00422 [Thalassiosira oceanica]